MRLFNWNVNGIRACVNKGFYNFVDSYNPDILSLEEIKASADDFSFDLPDYQIYINPAEKKGYSGTAMLSKIKPLDVRYKIGHPVADTEGRVITADFSTFYLVTCYVPNSQRELARLPLRMEFDEYMRGYLNELKEDKGVLFTGDLNVAHKEIDLKNPKTNTMNAGFTKEEREDFSKLLDSGFIDTFRYFYPDKKEIYSWWSYMFKAREKNTGWRIDYFVASENMKDRLVDAAIHTEVFGSDHCPVSVEIRD